MKRAEVIERLRSCAADPMWANHAEVSKKTLLAAVALLDAESALQQRVKELAEQHGSIRAAARVLMVDHAYLYRLSTGEKDDPGDDLLRKLKLRRVVSYVSTSGAQDTPPGTVQTPPTK